MPSNMTPNYQLNQWAAEDRVLRADFNADNAKIDAALHALDGKASTKAEQSALTAEVNTRTSQVAAINAALPKKGNCQLYYTTYIGTGELSQTVTFPKRPRAVMILGKYSIFRYIDGQAEAISSSYGGTGTTCPVSWSGGAMTWTMYEGSARSYCCNNYNELYTVIGLIDAAE